MQKLINFLIRNYSFILFLVLQLIAFVFILQANSFSQSTFFNSTRAISASILEAYHNAEEFANLKQTNQILAEENARLRSISKESYFPLFSISDTIIDTLYKQQYVYIPCKVVNSTYTYFNNHLTLNKGSKHGVEKGMGVINTEGVIGKVKEVSENYSVVYPLIHVKGQVTGRIRSSGHFGDVSWDGKSYDRVQLNKIQRHASFNLGDTIVSDQRSEIFPSGIPIGVIQDSTLNYETQFITLEINLLPDFTNIEYVYIINDLQKKERTELLERVIDNE